MTIIDDYIDYTAKYTALYGEDTLVLINIGDFYEIYGVDNSSETAGANLPRVCDILNIQASRKNKSIAENHRGNPLMAGFPKSSLKKYLDVLLMNAGYTVVLVEQVTPPPQPRREVTRVLSPSTYLDAVQSFESHYIMLIHVSDAMDLATRRPYMHAVCAMADTSTGVTRIHDPRVSASTDDKTTLEEMTRWMLVYRPKELVLLAGVSDTSKLSAWLSAAACPCKHNRSDTPASYHKLSYQTSVLQKVYPKTGLLSPIEYVDLERRPGAVVAFVALLDFVYDHNDTLISNMQPPIIIEDGGYLVLANQCVEHLDVVSPGHSHRMSIASVLNTCATAMGKRCLMDRLLHPITDPVELENRYSQIAACIENAHYTAVLAAIKPMADMERLLRRMGLGCLAPVECAAWIDSLACAQQLASYQPLLSNLGWTPAHTLTVRRVLARVSSTLERASLGESASNDADRESPFKRGLHPDIDDIKDGIARIDARFAGFLAALRAMAGPDAADFFKWDAADMSISITKKRYDAWVAGMSAAKKTEHAALGVTTKLVAPGNTHYSLSTPWWLEEIGQRARSVTALKARVQAEYRAFLADVFDTEHAHLRDVNRCVAAIDATATLAKQAALRKYCRPRIADHGHDHGASCLAARALRHPLIEIIQDTVQYVSNDIVLDQDTRGMLAYGPNGIGKSALMKSVGMAVIMAQAGMYVAADSFSFTPYTALYTRIPGGDNLHKGMSTFVVEMADLRNIFKRVDSRSLVLGDELCSGTEVISATSIVMAGVQTLSQRQASFVFATHLHEISKMERLKALTNVSVVHMAVRYDAATKAMVYDRKLQPGAGDSIYGLEVCRSLDVDPEFMILANQIRHELLNMNPSLVPDKTSRYNAKLHVDACDVCKRPSQEVHHIRQQKEADAGTGMIADGAFHKNRMFNLMNVCGACHDAIHRGDVRIDGYQQTTEGVVLAVAHAQQQKPAQPAQPAQQWQDAVAQLRLEKKGTAAILKQINSAYPGIGLTRYRLEKMSRS
jgi:DNA mismatch repair protein MutS